jgi:YtcA-like protein
MRCFGSLPLRTRRERGLNLREIVPHFLKPASFIVLLSSATRAFAIGGSILRGAPSFSLFGAFFPGWMFCALIGVIGAIIARAVMVGLGLAKLLPFQLFVCASIGLILGLTVWLVWFGR